jgi:thioredoxin reductase
LNKVAVAIIGAGPYGLSLAAHLAARNVANRIFGRPMLFWSRIAAAGTGRYLKSFCFGTDLSTPNPGFSFADYSRPRGLETIEPCSIGDFAAYGRWFQQANVPWVESVDVLRVAPRANGFVVTLTTGERFIADEVVIATGLGGYEYMPPGLASLLPHLATHTASIGAFSAFKDRNIAVIGAGQSALEAAALLHEAGARPQLLVRDDAIRWHSRAGQARSLWRRLRSPISKLGSGPKAWALSNFPGAMHRCPAGLRTRFVRSHLPAEGAWWLRDRVESLVPIRFGTTIVKAHESSGEAILQLRQTNGHEYQLTVDQVIAGTGYIVDVKCLEILDEPLRRAIQCIARAPRLGATFESSVPGLRFIGTASAMSFGPLFRFVAGAEYTARIVSAQLAKRASFA